jgi:acetyl esterase
VPLHSQTAGLLAAMEAQGAPDFAELSVSQARDVAGTFKALQGPLVQVASVRDRTVPGPAGALPIRIYTPNGAPRGVLVYFHGGGWVIGDLETHDVLCRQLTAGAGIAVVAVDYRLAPEHKFPAAADDALTATRWVAAHAGELGVDTARLAVGGDSAGGNLAAVVSLMARDQGGPPLAMQVLLYPVTDVAAEAQSYTDFADGFMLTRDSMRWFIAHYLSGRRDATDWRVSPLRAPSLAGVAPALVVTAGFDPLRDEGDAYARKLREAGVRVDAVCYGGMIHGFAPMGRLVETGNRAVAHVAATLREAFQVPA